MSDPEEKQPARLPGWMIPWTVRNREALLTFLVCLLVATALWFINALSKEYVTTIPYPVEYVNLPRNKFITNNPPEQFNLKVNTQGFSILKYKLIMSFNPLLIPVSDILSDVQPSSSGFYVISTRNLTDRISRQLSSDMQLLEINPGVLTLAFDSLDVKQVPVASRIVLNFKPRYGLTAPVVFSPSRVEVSGPHDLISKTDSIITIPKSIFKVDGTFRQKIALVVPRQLYVEPDRVLFTADVDEFTERTISLPVWISNQPDSSKVRLFPREVEVSFIIGLSSYTHIKPEDFSLYVSWEDIQKNAAQLEVKVSKFPSEIRNLKINPPNVEYLIERN